MGLTRLGRRIEKVCNMRFSRAAGFVLLAMSSWDCASGLARGANAGALAGARQRLPEGAALYDRECADCHGGEGEGGSSIPALMTQDALPKTREERATFRSAADVEHYIRTQMPLPKRRIGSLSDEQSFRVTAFILQARGMALPEAGLDEANAARVIVNP
jgi:mono/diheme cytochrome c family protein